jgi:bifunctional DNA-binding transcriptional regulator/antitoxin component of YhaV-PrlF toxin-antitoxin module
MYFCHRAISVPLVEAAMADMNTHRMKKVVEGLPTVSAKIRALDAVGFQRADIARFLDKRYQHVRNVLVQGPPKSERHSPATGSKNALANKRLGGDPFRIQIGAGGRIVIPTDFRSAMNVNEGDTLSARIEDGVLILMSADTAIRKAQELVRRYIPEGVSLVDDLIAERRAEAARETGQ